ncbi:MAG TPA: phasin family protein [Psychrobacter sp.]|nr:phasin family protein [Psychrobacter sp.]
MSFSTSKDYINQFNENTQKIFAPWINLNKAIVKNAEQMAEFSLSTLRTYTEMGLDNMRQLAEIDSTEAARNFSSKQPDVLSHLSQQILADAQRLTELGSQMQDEVMNVMSDVYGQTNEQMQSAIQQAADQASKTAQEFTANMNKMAEQTSQAASGFKATEAENSAASTASANTSKPNSSSKATVNKA